MFTNTYLPHVGGVARSVESFAKAYRAAGHRCLVIAPEFDEAHEDHPDTYRVPAFTNFNESGFSFKIPFLGKTDDVLDEFKPDIIHAHHPFLLGDTAVRHAYARNLPIVFTHHTLYEEYTNYLPFDSDFTKKAAEEIATGFANACSHIFAPSQSVADLISNRGVSVPISVQPTGIEVNLFRKGDGRKFRRDHKIPLRAPLIGHVGRIAKEKNLEFLTDSILKLANDNPKAYAAIVGNGEELDDIREKVRSTSIADRIIFTGTLQGSDLYDAYASFDLFAFASQSETQGLVLAEAMAGGAAVVALDGPGVRDVLKHDYNGTLLPNDTSPDDFAAVVENLISNRAKLRRRRKNASSTADAFSITNQANEALKKYHFIIESHASWVEKTGIDNFDTILNAIEGEFQLLKVKASTLSAAINA